MRTPMDAVPGWCSQPPGLVSGRKPHPPSEVRATDVATLGVDGLRFHDLRHTHATMAVAMGADTRTLLARMGHASARAALMYQHAQSDQPIADGFSADVVRCG